MAFDKDYYAILGVHPTAEPTVIRAAYKALAQKYHPDKSQAEHAESDRLMKDINEAYNTLSVANKRNEYDAWYAHITNRRVYGHDESSMALSFDDRSDEWSVATKIYPDLTSLRTELGKTSAWLADFFAIVVINSKEYQHRHQIARSIEKGYYERYFGGDKDINNFAKELIISGNLSAAETLNKYVRVLGSNAPAFRIINQIQDEFGIQKSRTQECPRRPLPSNTKTWPITTLIISIVMTGALVGGTIWPYLINAYGNKRPIPTPPHGASQQQEQSVFTHSVKEKHIKLIDNKELSYEIELHLSDASQVKIVESAEHRIRQHIHSLLVKKNYDDFLSGSVRKEIQNNLANNINIIINGSNKSGVTKANIFYYAIQPDTQNSASK